MGEFVRGAVLFQLTIHGYDVQYDHDEAIAQWIDGELIPLEGEEVQE